MSGMSECDSEPGAKSQVIRGKRPGRVEMRRGRLEGASADVAVEDMAGEEWSAPQSSLRCTSP